MGIVGQRKPTRKLDPTRKLSPTPIIDQQEIASNYAQKGYNNLTNASHWLGTKGTSGGVSCAKGDRYGGRKATAHLYQLFAGR